MNKRFINIKAGMKDISKYYELFRLVRCGGFNSCFPEDIGHPASYDCAKKWIKKAINAHVCSFFFRILCINYFEVFRNAFIYLSYQLNLLSLFIYNLVMDNYFSAQERRADMLQMLNQKERVMISEFCEKYGLSEVTIRKDLDVLKNRNLLLRIRGGAIRVPAVVDDFNDPKVGHKMLFHYKQKQAIGRFAATLIQENETIILDSGTTTMQIAKNLHEFENLTIVTNSIDIALEVSKYNRFNVILLGGHLRSASLSTVGPLAESVLKICYCDKLFLGVDSFSLEKGISTPNFEEANINQTMISMAKECIAVFDSSKFNKRSFAFIASLKDIDAIVTDSDVPSDELHELKKINIKMYIVTYH